MNVCKLKELLKLASEGGYRANLIRANLRGASLSGVDLSGANLIRADLCGANLRDANLIRANLRGASLSGVDLSGANLRGASLSGVDLRDANLSGADLSGASLSGANLSGADLSGANLIGANLWDCTGNRLEIVSVFLFDEYSVIYTSDCIQIGCERHAIDEWRKFDDRDIIKMDGKKSLEFWRKNKDFIFNIIEMKPAKPTHTQVNYEH